MGRRNSGGSWDWSPEVWGWSPDLGRWSPRYGGPKHPVVFAVTTDKVTPEEAYDYWCDIAYYNFEADRLPREQKRTFRASSTVLCTSLGNIYVYRSSPVAGSRTAKGIRADGAETFDIGIVLRGVRIHRDETGAVYRAAPGKFFCYDAAKESRVEWSEHEGIHVTLPRQLVQSAIGEIPPASQLVKLLETSSLSSILSAHLQALSRTLESLSVSERALIFNYTVDLILAVMRQVVRRGAQSDPADRSTYFWAAKRIIHQHLSDPNLDASMIARTLGCSRATLYRAFTEHGWQVAEYIREARLQEAIKRLDEEDSGATIESIAASCGFVNPSHFGRVFRSRFGITPRQARALKRRSGDAAKEPPAP